MKFLSNLKANNSDLIFFLEKNNLQNLNKKIKLI
jgi:hypothetical protein